ncbi:MULTISPECIES: hypothetical protein [Legionella]|uniref:Uncharacterized protein n=1 Tax=Legionella resiliens TaxID=2905958 RepID=A0ABS8WXJ7_9GAMM|nr:MULTISPECIES: hypothetical protein [unclassified Legionella]MCE0722014.1 hypothetical protein [Legionella sp. 9fVS26]MCE3531168.1 hypothetical protein [Legionella sp. 8cVS16]QLZ70756.1 hypothetical protein FOLKNPGA_03574 [Legionella sp. PC1000]
MSKAKINSEVPLNKLKPVGYKRQISVAYISPEGQLTSDDPNSYEGEKRVAYQNALLSQHPNTGYAEGILEERQKKPGFFATQKKEVSADSEPPAPTCSS